jgi:predicted Zn-dependent peptidase
MRSVIPFGTALALALVANTPALAQSGRPGVASVQALIPTETMVLPNGLRVVMNVDRSDPVVAVALVAHVGSARETKGRTGFAHMFEHLFFLNSENLGPGGLDKLSARVGGEGANGYTNLDHTVYLQTVPKDALEKMLWAEADKLGFFINTVTPAVVAKEIEVVKNEKRQSYDNQPYGHLFSIAQAALYPADHPYSWTTIGSLADLSAATLDDVRQFYRRWYVPNNATLVISGDIDPAQTRRWVEKYFGEIPRGAPVAVPTSRPAALTTTKRLTHLDSFAKLPQVTMFWPTVPEGAPDDVAAELLMDALTQGPDGPVYRAVVEQAKLSDAVGGQTWDQQMAGVAMLQVRAFDGVPLDKVVAAIDAGLQRFRTEGLSDERLGRLKAVREAALYAGIGSVSGKVQAIADSETLFRRPDHVDRQLAQLRAVTSADVLRAFDRLCGGQAATGGRLRAQGPAAAGAHRRDQGERRRGADRRGRGEAGRSDGRPHRRREDPVDVRPLGRAARRPRAGRGDAGDLDRRARQRPPAVGHRGPRTSRRPFRDRDRRRPASRRPGQARPGAPDRADADPRHAHQDARAVRERAQGLGSRDQRRGRRGADDRQRRDARAQFRAHHEAGRGDADGATLGCRRTRARQGRGHRGTAGVARAARVSRRDGRAPGNVW